MNTSFRRAVLALGLLAATATLTACDSQPDSSDVLREAAAGSCVRIGFASQDEWEAVGCDTDAASKYKVVSAHDGADTDASACKGQPDVDTGKIVLIDPKRTVCLRWAPKVGECVAQGQGHYFDCATGGGHKVTAVHQGVATDKCTAGEQARVYKDDPAVVCLAINAAP